MTAETDSNMLEVSSPNDAGAIELQTAVHEALAAQETAMNHVTLAIRRIVHAGQMLTAKKDELMHGKFYPWLSANGIVGDKEGQVSVRTVSRWMKLGEFASKYVGRLDNAQTVRQAYQLAGLLPDAEPATKTVGESALLLVIQRSSRLEDNLKAMFAQTPVSELGDEERAILRKRLEFYVQLYHQL